MPLNWPPPDPPSDMGPRRVALRERKRRKQIRDAALGAAIALVVSVVAVFVASRGGGVGEGLDPDIAQLGSRTEDRVATTLVIGTRETSTTAKVIWLSLISLDERNDAGAVVYIPAHTAVEVPGRGLMAVGDALSSGGMPLLLISVENVLGVQIDRYVDLSNQDARVLFEATGPISVDVPSEVRIPAGRDRARLIFTPGLQRLSAQFVVDLLYTVGLDGDDAELGARHVAFWDAFFETFESDPASLGEAVTEAGGALAESDVGPTDHAEIFEGIAELPPEARTITILPVTQISVGGDELYQTDEAEIRSFVASTLGATAAPGDDIRVQILNGNGVPGIGQEVAELLVGRGFRVILSGNAPRLNYRKTLIVTYDPSPKGQAIAAEARELIGLGQVQISAQDQGIVDLTIVVGKDFVQQN